MGFVGAAEDASSLVLGFLELGVKFTGGQLDIQGLPAWAQQLVYTYDRTDTYVAPSH